MSLRQRSAGDGVIAFASTLDFLLSTMSGDLTAATLKSVFNSIVLAFSITSHALKFLLQDQTGWTHDESCLAVI